MACCCLAVKLRQTQKKSSIELQLIKQSVNYSYNVETRICAAEMAVRYAALSACRKVHT